MGMKPVQANIIKLQSSHYREGLLCVGVRWAEAEAILEDSGLRGSRERGGPVVEYRYADQAKAVLRLNGFEVEE